MKTKKCLSCGRPGIMLFASKCPECGGEALAVTRDIAVVSPPVAKRAVKRTTPITPFTPIAAATPTPATYPPPPALPSAESDPVFCIEIDETPDGPPQHNEVVLPPLTTPNRSVPHHQPPPIDFVEYIRPASPPRPQEVSDCRDISPSRTRGGYHVTRTAASHDRGPYLVPHKKVGKPQALEALSRLLVYDRDEGRPVEVRYMK